MISVTNKSKIVNGVQHKQCSGCKRFKPLDEFYRFERGSLGVASECKKCSLKRTVEWIKCHRRKEKKKDPLDKYMTELPKT